MLKFGSYDISGNMRRKRVKTMNGSTKQNQKIIQKEIMEIKVKKNKMT